MTAGPYPTKEMFEGLKGRVTAVENAPTTASQPALSPYSLWALDQDAQEGQHTTASLMITWERRTVLPRGIVLAGNVEVLRVQVRPTRQENLFDAPFRMQRATDTTTVHFDSPFPEISEGAVVVDFTATSSLWTSSTPPAYGQGVQVMLYGEDAVELPGVGTTFQLLEANDRTIRVVPEPTTLPNHTLLEVVWQLGKTPYLRLVGRDRANYDDGVVFHLPLTPGLPQ